MRKSTAVTDGALFVGVSEGVGTEGLRLGLVRAGSSEWVVGGKSRVDTTRLGSADQAACVVFVCEPLRPRRISSLLDRRDTYHSGRLLQRVLNSTCYDHEREQTDKHPRNGYQRVTPPLCVGGLRISDVVQLARDQSEDEVQHLVSPLLSLYILYNVGQRYFVPLRLKLVTDCSNSERRAHTLAEVR